MTAPVGEVTSATARGQERQRALACGRERALGLQPALELLEPGSELADVVELDLVDDEAEPARLAEEVDPASEDEHLAVFGQRRDAPCVVREQQGIEPADPVLDGEVEMARRRRASSRSPRP